MGRSEVDTILKKISKHLQTVTGTSHDYLRRLQECPDVYSAQTMSEVIDRAFDYFFENIAVIEDETQKRAFVEEMELFKEQLVGPPQIQGDEVPVRQRINQCSQPVVFHEIGSNERLSGATSTIVPSEPSSLGAKFDADIQVPNVTKESVVPASGNRELCLLAIDRRSLIRDLNRCYLELIRSLVRTSDNSLRVLGENFDSPDSIGHVSNVLNSHGI
ncbi:MAG: hypothetical protein ACYCOU_01540 [Sulfobacillus sp.]